MLTISGWSGRHSAAILYCGSNDTFAPAGPAAACHTAGSAHESIKVSSNQACSYLALPTGVTHRLAPPAPRPRPPAELKKSIVTNSAAWDWRCSWPAASKTRRYCLAAVLQLQGKRATQASRRPGGAVNSAGCGYSRAAVPERPAGGRMHRQAPTARVKGPGAQPLASPQR